MLSARAGALVGLTFVLASAAVACGSETSEREEAATSEREQPAAPPPPSNEFVTAVGRAVVTESEATLSRVEAELAGITVTVRKVELKFNAAYRALQPVFVTVTNASGAEMHLASEPEFYAGGRGPVPKDTSGQIRGGEYAFPAHSSTSVVVDFLARTLKRASRYYLIWYGWAEDRTLIWEFVWR